MFDIQHKCRDGVVRTLGMAFDVAIGKRDHPRVLVTKNGSTLTPADWAKLKLKARRALASDDLPESVRAPHAPTASDAEHRIELLRHYLRGRGMDEESIEEACDICKREMAGEVSDDELPVSGPGGMGGRLSDRSREGGEKVFKSPGHFESRPPLGTRSSGEKRSTVGEAEYRSSPASDASFDRRYPGVRERLGRPVHGTSQYDPTPALSKRERQIAADAALDGAGDRLSQRFGEHFASIKVGTWR
jgi:hypothetical protein